MTKGEKVCLAQSAVLAAIADALSFIDEPQTEMPSDLYVDIRKAKRLLLDASKKLLYLSGN